MDPKPAHTKQMLLLPVEGILPRLPPTITSLLSVFRKVCTLGMLHLTPCIHPTPFCLLSRLGSWLYATPQNWFIDYLAHKVQFVMSRELGSCSPSKQDGTFLHSPEGVINLALKVSVKENTPITNTSSILTLWATQHLLAAQEPVQNTVWVP